MNEGTQGYRTVFHVSLAILTVCFCVSAGQGRAQTVIKGPYPQNVTKTSVKILFETDQPTAGRVVYGAGTMFTGEAKGPKTTMHEIKINGLKPATEYKFLLPGLKGRANRYADDGINKTGGSFKTAVEGNEPFTFLFYGDTRTHEKDHFRVVSAARKFDYDFGIISGDLVETGDVEEQWQTFFDVEHELMRRTPLYAVVGNHDDDDDAELLLKYFANPVDSSGNEAYYSFVYGNSLFVVIDHHVHETELMTGKQSGWLQQTLAAYADDKKIKNRFVLVHVPPFCSKPGRPGSAKMYKKLGLFLETGVDLLMGGHNHHYERGLAENGVVYLTCGGGGAPLYDTLGPRRVKDPPHDVLVGLKSFCFVKFDVNENGFKFTAYNEKGDVIDKYEKK